MSNDASVESKGVDKMSEDNDLRVSEQRAFRETAQDGLLFVVLSLYMFFAVAIIFNNPLLTFLLLFVIILFPFLLEQLRKRHTYRRLGYVKLIETPSRDTSIILSSFALIFVLAWALLGPLSTPFDLTTFYSWTPLMFGFFLVGFSIWLANRSGSRMYYIFGLATVATGLIFPILELGDFDSIFLYFLLWGVLLVVGGSALLVRFIRNYPLLESMKEVEYDGDMMPEEKDLIELEQTLFRESIEDGLEIVMVGLLILFVACMGLDMVFSIVLVSVMVLKNRILDGFRRKITYKRIGQVQLLKHKYDDVQKGILIVFLMTVVNIAFWLMLFSPVLTELIVWIKWFPAIFGLLFIGPSYYIYSKTGYPLWFLLGIGATILGFFFSLIEFTPVLLGWFFYLLSIGGILVIAGCIAFIRFLRNNPVIAIQEDVGIE
ncbi:MAG: hypothetical protein ACTSUO_08100 [Candidatus Thorarchaeota archaeon]